MSTPIHENVTRVFGIELEGCGAEVCLDLLTSIKSKREALEAIGENKYTKARLKELAAAEGAVVSRLETLA